MSTYGYSRSGSDFDSATPQKGPERCDLIDFLDVVQKNKVNFISIDWQQGLDLVGLGGTAEIRESLMNLQTSLAVKRRRFGVSCGSEELETQILPSLIAEISILSHPLFYQNINIVQLEGVGWEVHFKDYDIPSREETIDLSRARIIPTLIFEKTKHGDIHSFSLHAGRDLGIDEKLNLCIGTAKAIADMHANSEFSTCALGHVITKARYHSW